MSEISIIIPCYNVEKYISRCLKSLINQTFKYIQIIVVDDGSTDSTANIVKSFNDSRIEYYYKENGGLSDTRNFGMRYVKGKYISFIDGDDYLELNTFELVYDKFNNENADVVCFSYFKDYSNKTVIKIEKKTELDYIKYSPYNAWNKVMKKDLVLTYSIFFAKGLWYEDFNFNLKLASYVNNVSFIEIPLYHYIQRDGSIMHTINPKVKDIYLGIDDIIQFYKEQKNYEKYFYDLEYLFVKELLIASGKRFLEYDKKNKTRYLIDNYDYINEKYPNWRKNKYMENPSKVNLVLHLIRKWNYNLIVKLLSKLEIIY